MKPTKIERVANLASRKGLLRPRDLAAEGIPRQYLLLALRRGLVERVGRGLYKAAGQQGGEHHSLAEVCTRVPKGVICLLSALGFHGLTTQVPFEVWIAIGEKARIPRLDMVAIRTVRFSGPALAEGVEMHVVDGVTVRVYSAAKTVADCFKYRNKTGLDVAIEALRDCLRTRKASIDELVKFSRVCRVERVMRPYLEASV